MIKFKPLILTFLLSLLVIVTACDTSPQSTDVKICPQCNMVLPDSKIHTAKLKFENSIYYFDDIGCMILWIKHKNLTKENLLINVYSTDTKRYLDAPKAFYKIDEKTPMMYGFSAYESKQNKSINFDEVVTKMLRGEHMANPKIRKQILGY